MGDDTHGGDVLLLAAYRPFTPLTRSQMPKPKPRTT